jgi:hypothetical protein
MWCARKPHGRVIGEVSTDTAGLVIVDPTYLMTAEDHDAGRESQSLAPEYDAV